MAHTEGIELTNANRNSTFGFYDAADSCSKIGDSVSASLFLMKVNPYTLLFEKLTPQTIDTFLLHNFLLTKNARLKYKALFIKTFNATKSAAYQKFKQMSEEDQDIRNENIAINDTPGFLMHHKKMRTTDSVHFAYLQDYVSHHGWPLLSDGSMYACVIAMHDHKHHINYIPLLKKAVLSGVVDLEVLRLMQYWNSNDQHGLNLNSLVKIYAFSVFNANEMFNNELPKCLPNIEKTVTEHTPVILKVMVKTKNNDDYDYYAERMFAVRPVENCVLAKFFADVAKYDIKDDQQIRQNMRSGCWMIALDSTDFEKPEIYVYLFYGNKKELNYPSAFDKMLRGNKFVTHSIVFDVNQTTIKPESAVFLKQLSSWLKVNAQVNLIVSGHTDNAGDSTANLKLSLDRAEEVKRQLVYLGIDSVRLTTKGCGALQPVQSNNTPLGKARNRRVEFVKQ